MIFGSSFIENSVSKHTSFCNIFKIVLILLPHIVTKKHKKNNSKNSSAIKKSTFVKQQYRLVDRFDVIFLAEAREFLLGLSPKSREKIIFNIDIAKAKNDSELFKKLNDEIWEFRTLYNKTQHRIFAFWDKTNKARTLVFATHGIIKKTEKTPEKEIEKAEKIRLKYFEIKNKPNEK